MRAPPAPAPAALVLLVVAVVCAAHSAADRPAVPRRRDIAPFDPELPAEGGCQHDGRWFRAGTAVPGVGDACLRCSCAGGALACSRRACAQLPAPLPPRCHVRHRRDQCCPELHCPDSLTSMERSASARFENDDFLDNAAPHPLLHACVEQGSVFQAGSALHSAVACEQCFCLRGARRCVRPRCLPPPPGCRAPRSPGACCPQRYHCDHAPQAVEPHGRSNNTHDCLVDGVWVPEGERVPAVEARQPCTTCYCLRGAARCRPLACARALLGCRPVLRAGECCPHKYTCPHGSTQLNSEMLSSNSLSNNDLVLISAEDRSFYGKTSREDISLSSTTNSVLKNITPVYPTEFYYETTSKVKRKISEVPPTIPSLRSLDNYKFAKVRETTTSEGITYSTTEIDTTTETSTDTARTSTDEMESYVKTVVNGTINCTTEFSSSQPTGAAEELAREAPEPVTDRGGGGFLDGDSFTINVTSSLHANPGSAASMPKLATLNNSKKTKEDYDYDYAEPTLPPSLPNLKIIPFVAADAVVDDDPIPKDVAAYGSLEIKDKFPVYYPKVEKETPSANRREDVYEPQYRPQDEPQLAAAGAGAGGGGYASLLGLHDLAASLHEYALSASIGDNLEEHAKSVTSKPASIAAERAPTENLFSPPVETEGGFVPKGPGIINEYYAVYPSTPPAPHIPNLTTSMQLDTVKRECISSDGRVIPEGSSAPIACSVCSCAWGELRCAPRPCPAPPPCRRAPPAANTGLCCGELVCPKVNKTTPGITTTTTERPKTTTIRLLTTIQTYKTKPNEKRTSASVTFTPTTSPPAATTAEAATSESNTASNESREESKQATNLTAILAVPSFSTSNATESAPISTFINETFNTNFSTSLSAVVATTTEEPSDDNEENEPPQTSQEYEEEEEEEEEDEGFSFGSVLKLLLSDNYDSTTAPPRRRPPPSPAAAPTTAADDAEDTTTATASTTTTTTRATTTIYRPLSSTSMKAPSSSYRPSTTTTMKALTSSSRPPSTRRPLHKTTLAPFVPMPPQHQLYAPLSNNFLSPTSVNRIDHLVLGEATAIKRTTSRPVPTFRPFTRPSATKPSSTTRWPLPTRPPAAQPAPAAPLPAPPGGGGGLLKLAGCNIYGRMYGVGGVVAELAAPCRECRCTELGVQCRDLSC